MKTKERLVLQYLVKNKNRYVTGNELSESLDISDRTVRTYIKTLNNFIENHGAHIDSKRGNGYQLKITQAVLFDSFLQKTTIISKKKGVHDDIVSSADKRINYVLNKLLIEGSHLYLDELAEVLFVSRSTLAKDLAQIKSIISPFSLKIVSRANHGFWVVGDEQQKRHFIMHYFFGESVYSFYQKKIGNRDFFNEINFQELTIIVLDACRDVQIHVSDLIIMNLVLHLALSIVRIKQNFLVKDLGLDSVLKEKIEYQVSKTIISRIERKMKIQFQDEEVSYLTLHLISKTNNAGIVNQSERSDVKKNLLQVLMRMDKDLGYNFSNDSVLISSVLEHLIPMMIRLKVGINLKNPLLDEIKTNYEEAFLITKKYFKDMSDLAIYEVSDDEWAYIVLYVMVAIQKQKDSKKIRVLIICSTGYGSAQLLNYRLTQKFGDRITVVRIQGYYEINSESLEDIDLILSAIDISSVIFNVPVIQISVFLNDEDIKKIENYVNDYVSTKLSVSKEAKSTNKSNQNDINILKQFLKHTYFKVYDQNIDKESIIDDLLMGLSLGEEADYTVQMKKMLEQREHMGTVVFDKHVAVPHPMIPVGNDTKMGVAIIKEGMFWNADFPEIKMVFLFSPSCVQNDGTSVLTRGIVNLIGRQDLQDEIIESKSFDTFKTIFLNLIQ